jgi:hypothetical protein
VRRAKTAAVFDDLDLFQELAAQHADADDVADPHERGAALATRGASRQLVGSPDPLSTDRS